MKIRNILAVGGGVMGSQPGFYYAMNGYDVVQYDISQEALATCREYHQVYVEPFRAAFPAVTDEQIEAGLARIRYSSDLAEAAKDADLVTESVPEVLELKRQVWADLHRYCPRIRSSPAIPRPCCPAPSPMPQGGPGNFWPYTIA